MLKELKKIKKEAEKKVKQNECQRDSDNRIIINMSVKDDDNFLSSFSQTADPVISSEVSEFIESSTQSFRPGELITLRIHSDCIDDNEKSIYEGAIKEHYMELYVKYKRELKRNCILALSFAVLGVLTLSFAMFYEYYMSNPVWTEVIDIAAWVFLWEAVDIFALRNRELKLGTLHCLSCMSMNIEYYPMTK